MKTFVVIPHYIVNEEVEQLAIAAIKSFKETVDCTVISVDDNSPKKSLQIKDISDIYIQREQNGGFAECCNTGFKYINEESYVVCANNDIVVYPGWFEEFDRLFREHGADMVGGLGYRDKNLTDSGYTHGTNFVAVGGLLQDWMFPGGFYMVKKSFFDEIGMYDENYRHGGVEDVDLFYRAKQAGKRLVMTPSVSYWHKEGATRYSVGEKERQSKAISENELYFEKKWGFHPIQKINSILTEERLNY